MSAQIFIHPRVKVLDVLKIEQTTSRRAVRREGRTLLVPFNYTPRQRENALRHLALVRAMLNPEGSV